LQVVVFGRRKDVMTASLVIVTKTRVIQEESTTKTRN
jgi:hypothetical protein